MATVAALSGPERPRRWTATEKARIVEESPAPGAVVIEVARRRDVHTYLLHLWRRQARLAAGGSAGFLPVAVAPQRRPSPTAISIFPAACLETAIGVKRIAAPNTYTTSCRRQLWIRLRPTPYRRDTSDTVAPGSDAASRIARFSSRR